MNERLITIYRAPNAVQAHLLKQLLFEREIPCRIVGESIMNVESLDSPVSVLVPTEHEELGRFIADAFDRNVIQIKTPDEEDESLTTEWEQWPECSACGTKRMTWCPYCHTIASDFNVADSAGLASSELRLLCSICDEPFEPLFYSTCAHCGRKFADGIEAEPVSNETANEIWRSTIGAAIFLAIFASLAWWILRS